MPIVAVWAKKVNISVGYRKPILMEQLDPSLLEPQEIDMEELNNTKSSIGSGKNMNGSPKNKGGFKHPVRRYVNGLNDTSAFESHNNSRSVSRHEDQRPPLSKQSSKKGVLGASVTQHASFMRQSAKII